MDRLNVLAINDGECYWKMRCYTVVSRKPYHKTFLLLLFLFILHFFTALVSERREALLSSASLPVLAAGVLGCFDSVK